MSCDTPTTTDFTSLLAQVDSLSQRVEACAAAVRGHTGDDHAARKIAGHAEGTRGDLAVLRANVERSANADLPSYQMDHTLSVFRGSLATHSRMVDFAEAEIAAWRREKEKPAKNTAAELERLRGRITELESRVDACVIPVRGRGLRDDCGDRVAIFGAEYLEKLAQERRTLLVDEYGRLTTATPSQIESYIRGVDGWLNGMSSQVDWLEGVYREWLASRP